MGSCAFWLKKKEKQACFPEKTRQHLQYLHFIQYTLYFPIQEKESKKIYYRPRLKRKCLFPSESIFNTASDFRRQESGNGKPPFRTKEWKINEEFSSGTTTRPLCLLPTTGNRHLPDGWPSILKLLTIFFFILFYFLCLVWLPLHQAYKTFVFLVLYIQWLQFQSYYRDLRAILQRLSYFQSYLTKTTFYYHHLSESAKRDMASKRGRGVRQEPQQPPLPPKHILTGLGTHLPR